MSKLKEILLRIASLATLLVFFFSTTGFVMYNHICDHHEQHYSLTQFDDCCESEPVIEETAGCCAEVTTCSTSTENSNCCVEDQSYYKLSNWYVPNEKKVSTTDCLEQSIVICEFEEEGQLEDPNPTKEFTTKEKKPDPRKYRLFNRVKIDPPLI
jgi:hypothetical protein